MMRGRGASNQTKKGARKLETVRWLWAFALITLSLLGGCGGDVGSDPADGFCTPDCTSKQCGDDGCGDPCGDCAQGELCNGFGICYEPGACAPDCGNRECGDDGCGGSCGTCGGAESCNRITGLCVAPVGLVWTDSIQSGSGQYGFDGFVAQHPIGNEVMPSDANGANWSRVPDPLGGSGYAIRQYGVCDAGGARSQFALWSFSHQEFSDLALSGAPIYVAQELYFPETIDAGGDGWAWLSLLDWHTTKDGTNRWHTSPGIMLKQDGSMRFQFAWGNGAGADVNGPSSDWSSLSMPVGEWFDLEMRWQFASSQTATVSVWINGQLALEQTGVQTAGQGHNVAELYFKLYGSDQGHTPWSPVGITKFVRNVRISGERIWR